MSDFEPPPADEPLPPDLAAVHIHAIAWSETPEQRLALMDNAMVHTGDPFAGGLIERIERDHVVLGRDGRQYVLRIDKQ